MAVGTDTLTIYKGEDRTLTFTMSPVVDISGWAILMTVAKGNTTLFTKAGVVTDGPNGVFTVDITDAESDLQSEDQIYLYDIWRTDAGSEVLIARGNYESPSIARTVT